MFKLFKKRTKTNEESIFPDAKDVHAEIVKALKHPSDEEILAVIEERKSEGELYAYFPHSVLSKATAKALRKKHYRVLDFSTAFKICWDYLV